MKKMAPVGQNREGDEVNYSDSGDSIFVTQKPAPAVLSRREKSPHLSPFSTQEDLADLEDEAFSSSSSDEEVKTIRNQKERILRVPTFNFSFPSKRKGRSDLPRDKIKKLNNYVMGGFFNSVKELWESYERGEDMVESLPAVDVDGECISPISEKDTMEDEDDIKVVERKHFATSIKAKSSRPWYTPKTRSSEEGKPSQELRGSQGERQKACKPTDKVAPSLAIQTSDRQDTLCRHLKETETFVTRDENTRTETETGKHQIENKKQLGNESNHELNPKRDTQRDRDPHTELLNEDGQSGSGNAECSHDKQTPTQSDVSKDTPCFKKMKKKGRERVETGTGQSREEEADGEPEEQLPGLLEDINTTAVLDSEPEKKKRAAAGRQGQSAESAEEASGVSSQADAERKKKKDADVGSKSTNKTADPPTDEANVEKKENDDANVTSDLPQTPAEHPGEAGADFEEETFGSSFSKIKKKRKKKQKEHPAASDQDVNFSNDAVTNADRTVKKKKKKMVDVSHTAEEDESVDDTRTEERDAELRTKKKKKLKNSWSTASCEDAAAPAENSVSVRKKKKKRTSSFPAADGEENGAEEEHNPLQSEAEKPAVSTNHLAATAEEFPESSAEIKIRVKKKKKRSAEQDCVKGEAACEEPKEPAGAEVKKKKKRKRDDGETTSPTGHHVDESQAEVPLRKKKTISPAANEDAESEFSLDSPKKFKKNKAAGKLSLEKKSFPKTADSEASKPQQTGRAEPDADCNFSPAASRRKQKKNKKRRLHDPNQEFLSNF